MDDYQYDLEELCDDLTRKTGIEVNSDKLYWQSNSQGPYPEWRLSEVFDTIEKENYTIEFDSSSCLDVLSCMYIETEDFQEDSYGGYYQEQFRVKDDGLSYPLSYSGLSDKEIDEIYDIAKSAQDFLDKVWKLINKTCTAYPDRDWVRDLIDVNDYEFRIDADGSVSLY